VDTATSMGNGGGGSGVRTLVATPDPEPDPQIGFTWSATTSTYIITVLGANGHDRP
jgi:hypothetical protein